MALLSNYNFSLCLFILFMQETPKSQRQLLFDRVQKQKLAETLSRSIGKLQKTESKLSSSRLSSQSSSSLGSLRRAYSSTAIQSKSSSRQKLLRDIIEKLRHSKQIQFTTPPRAKDVEAESPNRSSRNRVNKLEQMMRDIKKCNQMSTKAVYSIKKNFQGQQPVKREQAQGGLASLAAELVSVRQELELVKRQNRKLMELVGANRSREECIEGCRCRCHH